jgi:hypothetical protein
MQWLMGLFHLVLPTLPLSGIWSRFTALWELPVTGKLPDPSEPLPWNIDVESEWAMPVSGVRLVPARIVILVTDSGGSPQSGLPLVRRRKTRSETADRLATTASETTTYAQTTFVREKKEEFT